MKRLVLLLLPMLSGCGYALVGSANNLLAPTVHTIEVPAFVNRTTRVELEQRVTQSVAAEFVSRGRLKGCAPSRPFPATRRSRPGRRPS